MSRDFDEYRDEYDDRPRREVPSYLALSILSTLFCCLPFGIVAIVQSAQVSGHVASGNYRAAERASSQAMNWNVASIICGLIIIVAYVALVMSEGRGFR